MVNNKVKKNRLLLINRLLRKSCPMKQNILSINDLSDAQIAALLHQAELWQQQGQQMGQQQAPPLLLAGKSVMLCFFENSTRTRVSFERAAGRLGAQVQSIAFEQSALSKGESQSDTLQTLAAMQPAAIVIRHAQSFFPHEMAAQLPCAIVNAGDGTNEHPTQALLDALTIKQVAIKQTAIKQTTGHFAGLKVVIVGDIKHSRVARSHMLLLPRLGINLHLVAPPHLMPNNVPQGVSLTHDLDSALPDADFVMALRIQKERMHSSSIPDAASYYQQYGLTHDRLSKAAPKAFIMHPGPMNRGLEISDALADDPTRSLILRQVQNGVAIRMACLAHCAEMPAI